MYLNKQEQKALVEIIDIVKNSQLNKPNDSWNNHIPRFINEAISRNSLDIKSKRKLAKLTIYPYGKL